MNDEEAIKEFEEWIEINFKRIVSMEKELLKAVWLASRHVLFEKHPELVSFIVESGCMDETED